jgi:hypothetical protein
MIMHDAAIILGIQGKLNPEIVKAAYRAAMKRYHPDVNPAGLDMAKLINDAFDALKDCHETITPHETGQNYPEALSDALNAIIALAGLELEICGAWLWVSGDTLPHKEALKAAAFQWAPKKKQWYFRPDGFRSFSRGSSTMQDIRTKYGSCRPERQDRPALS